eukprot:scaffold2221_cov28-Tisochrysis_lutea.AAC.2
MVRRQPPQGPQSGVTLVRDIGGEPERPPRSGLPWVTAVCLRPQIAPITPAPTRVVPNIPQAERMQPQ